jgi:flagellar basal-body rod protein FlgG
MIRAPYAAASCMSARQLNVDTIANNLANANTTADKTRRTQFQDIVDQNLVQPRTAAGQANSKVVKAADEMYQQVNDIAQ